MSDFYVGIDVGGTSAKIGLVKSDGSIVEKTQIQTLKTPDWKEIIEEYAKPVEGSEVFDEKGQSSFVKGDGGKQPLRFSDIAILIRANSHAEPFVQALMGMGIPYKLGGSRGLYSRPEIQNLIAFLKVLVDYSDEIAMYKLLAMSVWKLTPREYMDINRLAREERLTLFEELEKLWNIKLGQEEKIPLDEIEDIENPIIEKIFNPQEIFNFIQKHANLNDYEMYQTFNMGMDYAIFLPKKDIKKAQRIVKKNGFESLDAGYVEKGERQVIIKPKNIIFKSYTLELR